MPVGCASYRIPLATVTHRSCTMKNPLSTLGAPGRRGLLRVGCGVLAAAAFRQGATAQTAAKLRIGLGAPNTTMDPHLQSNAPNNAVASHIFDALVTNDEKSRSMPGLAESWQAVDDTHWVFKLREGVRFTDGAPFTVTDVIASLKRATELPSTASFRTYTRSIRAMTARDPHTFLIETHAPDPLLPNSLSRVRIISARFADAPSSDFNSGRAAIGTGPFVFREYVPGSHVALTRNEGWWGDKPAWTDVLLRTVTDPGARLATLLAGDLDLIETVPAQGSERLRADARLHLIRGISSRLVYVAMDQRRDVTPFVTDKGGKSLAANPLRDLRVRQAMDCAINRQALVDRVMEGNAVAASQYLPTGSPGTAAGLEPTKYDPERAKALLAQAGYPQGFQLTMHGPNDRYVNDSRIVQAMAQMLTRVGIDTKVEVMPWAVYAGRAAAGEFSVFLASWGVNTGETSNPLSATAATQDKPAGLGIANDAGYSNTAVDAKLKQALRTMDDAQRNAILGEACALVFADKAILPLHHEVTVWGARKDISYTTRSDQYTLATGVGRSA
jgi:peptide/nickel transport system substrate-binding protein